MRNPEPSTTLPVRPATSARRVASLIAAALAAALATAAAAASPAPAPAQALASDATRLGAFAGAMRWCEEKVPEREQRRYRWARLRAGEEIDGMSRLERAEVLRARDSAYSKGRFFRDGLDERGCRDLLRASEWARFR